MSEDLPAPFSREYVAFIRRLLSVAETGEPEWNPSAVYVYADDNRFTPPRKQITLSIGFTESGNLKKVLQEYVDAGGSKGVQLSLYFPVMGSGTSLWNDNEFLQLLRAAGQDPVMEQIQRDCFERFYLGPAFEWASEKGFSLALSYLVIADSFLHSGSMLGFLMNRFPEKKPCDGGEEKAWIKAYVRERKEWLAGHSNQILRNTVYRCDCFQDEITRDNWDMTQSPIVMNDTPVYLT